MAVSAFFPIPLCPHDRMRFIHDVAEHGLREFPQKFKVETADTHNLKKFQRETEIERGYYVYDTIAQGKRQRPLQPASTTAT
jgi:hypothetical protein